MFKPLTRVCLLALIFLVSLTACAALEMSEAGTEALPEGTALAVEVTAIAETLVARGTEVAATSASGATYVAMMDGINRSMVATVRAAIPPTQQIVQGPDPSAPLVSGVDGMSEDVLQTGDTGTGAIGAVTEFPPPQQAAASVRASDGCAEVVTSEFRSDVAVIYVTGRALNIRAGTELSAQWSVGGQVVYNWSFSVEMDDPDFCFWFSITPDVVTFTPGTWSVRLLANGAPIGAPVTFTIVEAM